jgi:hypothetical protein
VRQVLEQLPEGLAIAVMAAPSTLIHQKLHLLPTSLHPLAVEAVLLSIRRHGCVTLNFHSRVECTANKMLHTATTATISLKKIHLKQIPVCNSGHILELIPVACKSASDVSLDYGNPWTWSVLRLQHLVQLGAVLSQNSALTSLHFAVQGQPNPAFKLDSLTDAHTGLQSLSLYVSTDYAPSFGIPPLQHMLRLTRLQIGRGLNLMSLPQILPHLTRLKALHLSCGWLKQLPPLTPLTALQTLSLSGGDGLQLLPPLITLTALRTLTLQDWSTCESCHPDCTADPQCARCTALAPFATIGHLDCSADNLLQR